MKTICEINTKNNRPAFLKFILKEELRTLMLEQNLEGCTYFLWKSADCRNQLERKLTNIKYAIKEETEKHENNM